MWNQGHWRFLCLGKTFCFLYLWAKHKTFPYPVSIGPSLQKKFPSSPAYIHIQFLFCLDPLKKFIFSSMGGIFQQTNENIKHAWMLEYRKYMYGKFRCVLPRPNGLFREKSRQPSNQQTLWPKFAQKKALSPYIFLGLWSREIKRGGEGIFPLLVLRGNE